MAIFAICPKGRILEFWEGRRSVTRERDWSRLPLAWTQAWTWEMKELWPWGLFLESPDNWRPSKLLLFTSKIEVSIVLHLNMIKLLVNETKWSSLLARTRALILYIRFENLISGAKRQGHPKGHPTTVVCKLSLWKSNHCLEFSIAWGRLQISRWPFHLCTIFETYLINSLRFSEAYSFDI